MDLTPYVEALRTDLAVAAEAGGQDARALAERLVAPLESATRLALLDVLSAAASEITRDLAPGSVEVRLRGREPSFVVTPPPAEPSFAEASSDEPATSDEDPPGAAAEGDDVAMTRINLRLTQDLKDRVEAAARQAGLSVNAWLVRSATVALMGSGGSRSSERRAPTGGERYTGWVR